MAVPDHWRETAPGLAGVRTALAWQRSLLLVVVTGIAIAKYAADGGAPLLGAIAGGIPIAVGILLAVRTSRGQVVAPDWGENRRTALQALTATALLSASLALLTVALVR